MDDFDELWDEIPTEELPPKATQPSLTQMEADGEAFAAELERVLAENPDTPTEELLRLKNRMVLPMSAYRPTEEELAALRIADIQHTLRGEKNNNNDPEEEEQETSND